MPASLLHSTFDLTHDIMLVLFCQPQDARLRHLLDTYPEMCYYSLRNPPKVSCPIGRLVYKRRLDPGIYHTQLGAPASWRAGQGSEQDTIQS